MAASEDTIVTIGGVEFIRHGDAHGNAEWFLYCGCGDLVALEDVVHDHCANCHVLCQEAS